MANRTLTQYPSGAGSYRINFDYLARPFVVVELVSTGTVKDTKRLVAGDDYKFVNPSLITITASQVGFDILQIRRETSSEPLVNFVDGSVLSANNLTTSEMQAIHIAEEGRDQTTDLAKQYVTEAQQYRDEAKEAIDTIVAMGSFGYTPVGSFESGGTVNLKNEALSFGTDAAITYWRWEGVLPKVVPAGSTPETAGGTGTGKWKDVTDTTLRGQLAGEEGYKLVPSIQVQKWREEGDVRGWGAKNGEDATEAINAAIAANPRLGWGTARKVFLREYYKIEGKVLLPTDTQLIGEGCTIGSTSDDWIIESAYRNASGKIVSNLIGLTDEQAIYEHRLKGVHIEGITFAGVSRCIKLRAFTQGCGLNDLVFDTCGIAFDTRLSFYPTYRNILIRSVKAGFEEEFAYQLRHQCNQVLFEKVTISERKNGELIDDDIVPSVMPAIGLNCQHINHIDCTYEGVERGAVVRMKTFGYTNVGIYAEVVSGNLFEFTTSEHTDVKIVPKWFAGVEKMGHFTNLRGRSEITQCKQFDYIPSKRSAMQFTNSVATVYPAVELGVYKPLSAEDLGVAFDGTSSIHIPYLSFAHSDVPVKTDATNFARQPAVISGMFPTKSGKVIGATSYRYDSVANKLIFATDIYWSECNCLLVGLTLTQNGTTTPVYNHTSILMNGFSQLIAGGAVSYFNDGGLTGVSVANPAGSSVLSWMTNNNFTVQGCIRLV